MSREQRHLPAFINDFLNTLKAYRKSYEFIKENRLWEGMTRYKAILVIFILIGLVLGLKILDIVQNMVSSSGIGEMGLVNTMSMVRDVAKESYHLLFLGGMKYIVLIFLEIIIFHFVRRTLEVKTGKVFDVTLKAFLVAEVRMIKVVIFSFVMETIIGIGISIVLGIWNAEFLKVFLVLLVQMYFLGFAFIDNYNELSGLGIRESERDTRKRPGVAIGIGSVAYILLLIPIAGSIIAPVLGGVAATLVMFDIRKPVFEPEAEAEPGDDFEQEPPGPDEV